MGIVYKINMDERDLQLFKQMGHVLYQFGETYYYFPFVIRDDNKGNYSLYKLTEIPADIRDTFLEEAINLLKEEDEHTKDDG